jgi:DNA-directed RNA polymerase II subunit RPB2
MERDCLAEDHQILTNRGFQFLHELEANEDPSLLIGSYDPETKELVYEKPNELIVKPSKTQTMIELTHSHESHRWASDSDAYGRKTADTPTASGHSNNVSLMITPTHDMYVRTGRASPSNNITWKSSFAKVKANTLVGGEVNGAIQLLSMASGGIRTEKESLPFLDSLSLNSSEKLNAFLEVYGYWLGDGSLMFKAYGGRDAVHFSIVKDHDVAWLLQTFGILELKEGTHFTRGSGAVGSGNEHKIYITHPGWSNLFITEYRHKYKSGNPMLLRPTTVAGRHKGERQIREGPVTALPSDTVSTIDSSSMVAEDVKSAKWCMNWVWSLNKSHLRMILRGLRRADGSEAANQNIIYTSSVRFRDELMRICLHAGYAPRFTIAYLKGAHRGISRLGTPIIATKDNWRISYSEGITYSQPSLRQSRDTREVTYTGRTWCVNVPHGFIVVRRAHVQEGIVIKASVPVIMGNCVIGHGMSEFTKERLMECSDAFLCYSCRECGLIAIANEKEGIWACRGCSNTTNFAHIQIPYASKLLMQELETMCIGSRLVTNQKLLRGALPVESKEKESKV